jgi:2-phosphosulfolactate phosphatase
VLLAGEKNCVKIPGFQLGNSPLEMTEAAVRGKSIILTTSNGTQALLACQGASSVFPAAAVNLAAAAEKAREALETDRHILVVCAGRAGAFALDDAYCAGRLTSAVLGDTKPRRGLNDAAIACLDLVRRYRDNWERPLARSRAGRELGKLGFGADVKEAARLDAYPVLPHFHERRVTLVAVPV